MTSIPCICQPSHYQQWYQQNEEVDQLVLFLAFPEARWMHKIRCRTVSVSNHNCIQWVEVRPNPIKEKVNGTKCQVPLNFDAYVWTLVLSQPSHKLNVETSANGRNHWKITKKKWNTKEKKNKQTKYLIRKYFQTVSLCLRGYESPSVGAESRRWEAVNVHYTLPNQNNIYKVNTGQLLVKLPES